MFLVFDQIDLDSGKRRPVAVNVAQVVSVHYRCEGQSELVTTTGRSIVVAGSVDSVTMDCNAAQEDR
jgi:hypothetical protein